MQSVDEIAYALRAALPQTMHDVAGMVAALLAEVLRGEVSIMELQQRLQARPQLLALLQHLAGQQIGKSDAVISFGTGNTLGNVRIGNVAGRDQITINVMTGERTVTPVDPRPLRAYLSSTTPDGPRMRGLCQQLQLRGLVLTRARTTSGAIDLTEVALCILHMTPDLSNDRNGLTRDLDALRDAWRTRPFPVLIVRDGIDDAALHAFVRPADLGWQNLALPAGNAGLQKVAATALATAIKAYPTVIDAGKIEISLFSTEPSGATGNPALILDWRSAYEPRYPNPATWDKLLLPALRDLRSILGSAKVEQFTLNARARLSAGVALGFAFRATTETSFQIRQGPVWWHTAPHDHSAQILEVAVTTVDSTHAQLSIELNITQDRGTVSRDAGHYLQTHGTQVGTRIGLELPDGISKQLSEAQAQAIASQVRTVIQRYRRPGEVTHLFVAVPFGLAVMIGWHLNTLTPVQCYELPQGASSYEPACRLVQL